MENSPARPQLLLLSTRARARGRLDQAELQHLTSMPVGGSGREMSWVSLQRTDMNESKDGVQDRLGWLVTLGTLHEGLGWEWAGQFRLHNL